MKPTPVYRFYFSLDEAIAALFPSGIPARAREMRIEGDELIVDFVDPKTDPLHDMHTHKGNGVKPADDQETPSQDPDDDFPGDRPSPGDNPDDDRPPAKVGPNEKEARDLCAQRGFQTFLEVKTEEAAIRVTLNRVGSVQLKEIDSNKYKKANFRDLVGEYEAWLRG